VAGLRRRPKVLTDAQGSIQVVTLSGEVGADTVRELDRTLSTALESPYRAVVVDLRRVTFIDRTSLRVLVKGWRRATNGGVGFTLVRPERRVWRLFALAGLDLKLPSCSSLQAALLTFEAPARPVENAPAGGHPEGRSGEALIHSDPETVFNYLAELEHATEWRPEDFRTVTKETPGPTAAGSRYEYVTRWTGIRGEWIVDALVEPHWLRCTSPPTKVPLMGRVWGSEDYMLFAEGEETRISVTFDVHFGGPLRAAGPLLTATMGRRLKTQLRRLKQRVEA
jgi:anti-anti-sigma factor